VGLSSGGDGAGGGRRLWAGAAPAEPHRFLHLSESELAAQLHYALALAARSSDLSSLLAEAKRWEAALRAAGAAPRLREAPPPASAPGGAEAGGSALGAALDLLALAAKPETRAAAWGALSDGAQQLWQGIENAATGGRRRA
jgi:hypothetical protein